MTISRGLLKSNMAHPYMLYSSKKNTQESYLLMKRSLRVIAKEKNCVECAVFSVTKKKDGGRDKNICPLLCAYT